jgi:hypothetical protein
LFVCSTNVCWIDPMDRTAPKRGVNMCVRVCARARVCVTRGAILNGVSIGFN